MKTVITVLEATCCDNGSFPRDEMEIIEIGAVLIEGPRNDVTSDFQTFVKPRRHPILTAFCMNLTSIAQADVDNAPEFKDAFGGFLQWFYGYGDPTIASWGAYDLNQIFQDCELNGLAKPQFRLRRNLKEEFSKSIGTKKRFGMGAALERLGLKLDGTHHRGIDDARNIAKILKHIEGGSNKSSQATPVIAPR